VSEETGEIGTEPDNAMEQLGFQLQQEIQQYEQRLEVC
jgi:hypothetical protein